MEDIDMREVGGREMRKKSSSQSRKSQSGPRMRDEMKQTNYIQRYELRNDDTINTPHTRKLVHRHRA